MTRISRAERMAMPFAPTVLRDMTEAAGGCIRPVQMRRTNTVTGEVDYQMIPCGATLDTACKPCAERARSLRAERHRRQPGSPNHDRQQRHWRAGRRTASAIHSSAAGHAWASAQEGLGQDDRARVHVGGRKELPAVDVPHSHLR